MAVEFNKEYVSKITEGGVSRGDALRSRPLIELYMSRADISDKAKASKAQILNDLGFGDITLGDLVEETGKREAFINAILEKGSNTQTNGLIGDFKNLFAEVGVTAQGTTNPFRTMMVETVGKAAYESKGFGTTVDRLVPLAYPREAYTESKRIVASLLANPETKSAGGRMLLQMMGGYRPSDFKALKLENINFETGEVKGLELKTDSKAGKKVGSVAVAYLPTAQRDVIRHIAGERTSGLVFPNASKDEKIINDALKTSAIPQIEYMQESTGEYVKQDFTSYDFRRIMETNLSAQGFDETSTVRKALTWRPQAGNVQKYQAVINASGAIEDMNAKAFEPYVLLTEGNTVEGPQGVTKTHGQFLADVGITDVSPFTKRYSVTATGLSRLPVFMQDYVAQQSRGIKFAEQSIAPLAIEIDPSASQTYVKLAQTEMEVQQLEAEKRKRQLAQEVGEMLPVEQQAEKKPQMNTREFADVGDVSDKLRDKLASKGIKLGLRMLPFGVGAAATFTELQEAGASPIEAGIQTAIEETTPMGVIRPAVEAVTPVVKEAVEKQVPEEGFVSGLTRAFTGMGMGSNFNSGGFVNKNGR